MPAIERFTHRFVEFIPDELDHGVLYVSLPYTTVLHLCACGCGTKVVCVLDPSDYAITFNGETISLWPSLGNWDFHCRSHYIIRHGRVLWAPQMSESAIAAGRRSAKRTRVKRDDLEPAALWATLDSEASTIEPAVTTSAWRRLVAKIRDMIG